MTNYAELLNKPVLTTSEYIQISNWLRGRAVDYERAIDRRVRALGVQAGLRDGDYFYIHLHNAWVCGKGHKFWANVDYTLLHFAHGLDGKRWEAHHIIDRYLLNLYQQRVIPGFAA